MVNAGTAQRIQVIRSEGGGVHATARQAVGGVFAVASFQDCNGVVVACCGIGAAAAGCVVSGTNTAIVIVRAAPIVHHRISGVVTEAGVGAAVIPARRNRGVAGSDARRVVVDSDLQGFGLDGGVEVE